MLTVQPFSLNPLQENTYVVYNEKGDCGIIDPGCYFSQEEEQLTAFIKQKALKPILLLNTHCHLDHIFGARFINNTYGLLMHLHPLEKQVLDRGPEAGQLWGMPFENYDDELVYIEEGQVIRLGDDELHVLFTPGHSPGSVSFYSRENKFVLSGDVLFNGSVGRTDLPGGDFATLAQSIKTKLYTLPPDTIVYSGHGTTTTIGDELKTNPFVKME